MKDTAFKGVGKMRALILVALVLGIVVIAAYIFFGSRHAPPTKVPLTWGEPAQIANGIEVNSVKFLSDGQLLFTGNDGIFLMNADGTDMRTLFYYEGIGRAAMSPNGKKIVFDNDFDILTANPDGSDLKPLSDDPDVFEFGISFTPDGRAITFVTIDDVNSTYGIWIMNADGSNKRNLLLSNDVIFRHLRQSPDGKRISYFITGKDQQQAILVMDSAGNNTIALTDPNIDGASRQASWSPDGKQLVYSSNKAGNFDIWLMDADGSNKTQITHIPGAEAKPVWSPDSQAIAFLCSDCFNTISSNLYIISRK